MRLGAHRPLLADLEIEQELIGVVLPAEAAERRPFQAFLRRRPEIAVEHELAILLRDLKLVVVGIEDFDSVLRSFGERHAVPGVFVRAVLARCRLPGPAGHFKLGPARLQSRMDKSEFHFEHGAFPQDRAKHASPDTIVSSLDARWRWHPR